MDLESLRIGRERLARVFRFLEALNQHRNPPRLRIGEQLWTLWLEDLPDHSAVRRGTSRANSDGSAELASLVSAREDGAFVLKVSRKRAALKYRDLRLTLHSC